MRIGLHVSLTDEQAQRLRQGAVGCEIVRPDAGGAADCEVIFGNPEPLDVQANAALQWMQLESVGFGEYADLDWQRDGKDVIVTNLAGFFADPVAETALAGILAFYRGLDRLIRIQASRDWLGDTLRPDLKTLRGARVLMLGRGAINLRLADLLQPFGCTIVTVARREGVAGLDAALGDADIIVCTVPSTPQTRDLFNQARFARVKQGAIFCNFGRGTLVDEAALVEALSSGVLGGAVIDVSRAEPLPQGNPLWSAPNLILTQHTGGGTGDEIDRKIDVFLANLDRLKADQPLHGVVDFSRGY
ncbi:D-2-hydroxyacid dehydrogenase [Mesorhizobium sp. RP14(2022)]|uniref:D-2-hydroxyacid dehydrogenase n=1 Tax=Mesorhizobium liriopis TaxID=2953882 RepID=A0ABT1CBP5_9HYPH|nr:D-2-hydroxyacid dehydrogenase [Mesorhizobium liriopis]MCO6052240.1 D-2-hydroxyacid dehydrogenase [Mesorhizobium liriopis]